MVHSTASLAAQDAGAVRLGTVRLDEATVPAIVFPGFGSSWRDRVLIAIGTAGLLVLTLVFVSAEPTTRYLGLGLMALMAGFWTLSYWIMRHDLRRVAISRLGIHAGNSSEIFVPWKLIKGSRLMTNPFNRLSRSESIALTVSDFGGVRLPRLYRLLHSWARRFRRSEVGIAPWASTATCAATIAHYLDHPEERDDIGSRIPAPVSALIPGKRSELARWVIRGLWIAWFLVGVAFVGWIGLLALGRLGP